MNSKRSIPEYDVAWTRLVADALSGFIAGHSLLGGMHHSPTQHIGPTRNVRGSSPLDQPLARAESAATISVTDIRETNVEAHTEFVFSLAKAHIDSLLSFFFQRAGEVSDHAGQTLDSGGAPLSWDLILDMYEHVSFSFDADGTPELPTLAVHPEALAGLGPITPEQAARLDRILLTKREEHVAEKRTRRLPRRPPK